jgi:hypothetical protein
VDDRVDMRGVETESSVKLYFVKGLLLSIILVEIQLVIVGWIWYQIEGSSVVVKPMMVDKAVGLLLHKPVLCPGWLQAADS